MVVLVVVLIADLALSDVIVVDVVEGGGADLAAGIDNGFKGQWGMCCRGAIRQFMTVELICLGGITQA